MRDGDSSSSELSAKEPISSFDGAVLERVGLGREELLDEGFGDLGDLGDLERFLGVEGEAFEVSSLTGTTFGATGFDGASFGDDAFDDGSFELETFGVEVFEGADFDTFAGVDGTLFDGAAFGGGLSSFFSCFRRDGVAGDVGVVVIGVGVWPLASCASCCARSFTLRNILLLTERNERSRNTTAESGAYPPFQ
jgi:hypothetical protein